MLVAALACSSIAEAQVPISPATETHARVGSSGLELSIQRGWVPSSLNLGLAFQDPGVVWSYPSDGSWIGEAVSLGNHGTQVFSIYGAFLLRTALFSAHDSIEATPVWVASESGFNYERRVVSAETSDVHATMHQETVQGAQCKAVLRSYTSASAAPVFEHSVPAVFFSQPFTDVAISEDGTWTVGLTYDPSGGVTLISSVQSDVSPEGLRSFSLNSETAVDTLGGVEEFALSADGSTLVMRAHLKTTVFDVATAQVVHEAFNFGQPNYGALDVAADGSLYAYGSLGSAYVVERDASGAYSSPLEHDLGPATFCRQIAVSIDGTRLAVGVQKLGQSAAASVRVLDTLTGAMTFEKDLSGSGIWQNMFSGLEFSTDASRLAVGLWGDEGEEIPEVNVFSLVTGETLLSHHFAGSVTDIDLSGNGDWLSVASKGTHANVMGGGGELTLLRVGPSIDLTIEGVPRLGSTVYLKHIVRNGSPSLVYASGALAASPAEMPEIGEGLFYLDATAYETLPLAMGGEGNVAIIPYAIPNDETLVGSTMYFQGLNQQTSELSTVYVTLTVLP